MTRYSQLIDRLIGDEDLLRKLLPTEASNLTRLLKIRAANDVDLSGEAPIANPAMFRLIRAGLYYACDSLRESHAIVNEITGDESAYWHGMIHRREGDFDNARYWYRRAGTLPFFSELHHAASAASSIVAMQSNWDPYLFTGQCEQYKFGDREIGPELVKLQRIEFEVAFNYMWRESFASKGV